MKLITIGSSFSLVASALAIDVRAGCRGTEVIARDIAVIGGGATGTYAAINLKDQGKSVVVVEQRGSLGGHTSTYHDPATGTPINYGVQLHHDDQIARDFYSRLNVTASQASFPDTRIPLYIDFTDGSPVLNYSIPPLSDDYIQALHKYPYLENGIELPDPVPEELLLTWPEYMERFNLTGDAFATYSMPAVPGDLTKYLALYVFNYLNSGMLEEEREGKIIMNADGDLAELYRNALAELGSDVLLNSVVLHGQRGSKPADGVKLCVLTPKGRKQIVAKQLVFAAPAELENLEPLSPDEREKNIMSEFKGGFYFTGIVTNFGLPTNYSYTNRGQNTESHIASVPGVAMFNPTNVEGTYYYWYNSLSDMTRGQVEADTRNTIKRLQRTVAGADVSAEPKFLEYKSHSPLHRTASADVIRKGIYRDVYSLQGYRNTWYTGSLLVVGSSQLWNLTSQLLPRIIAASEQ
ncbi:FAD/NAD(P)-binding domain-containing protein [Daldinia caldariorum]|uniref:FAD/NAD(P)-binding domain-containing protein n=1 Tax=Daldinia caldariorum TaxID=326644 RepID=UPI00200841F0|nr:FAD/NAD(P)-binding domain-containing protein [Daldinia caldariorum]KAI1465199.1 FAD/NAD(P)-binding domain-containing protein [Daldinia caldariorum]